MVSGERFGREHQHGLAQQLAAHDDNDAIAPLQRDITAQLPLRGQMLPLQWREGRFTRLQFDGDALVMQEPQRAGPPALRRALLDFYEAQARADRSAERRVGKECYRQLSYGWSSYH